MGIRIDVAARQSPHPGPRYRRQGPHSGEEFREDILLPAVRRAAERGDELPIVIDTSGCTYGCPVGWTEEVFGGARRALGTEAATRSIAVEGEAATVAEATGFLTGPD